MKVTINEIAKRAKVSKMTVSRVLSGKGYVADKTKKRIKDIMAELNYQPNLIARSLSSSKTLTLGVIIPKTHKLFLDNYIAQVLSGVTDIAQAQDYRIMLFPYEDLQAGYMNIVRSRIVDGLVLLKTKMTDKYLDELAESKFPFVLVSHRKVKDDFNFVDSENITGAKKAVEYFVKKGHKKIGFVAGSTDETNAIDRLEGYKSALEEAGIRYNEDYVIYCDFDKEKAYQETGKLLELKEPPTAIFSSDDYMAIGVIERIKKEGYKVPEDISVIGFDDIEIAEFVNPPLTTIRQPMYELGKNSAELLLEIINNKIKTPAKRFLATELIIRETA